MSDDDSDSDSSRTTGQRQNEVELRAGNLEVTVKSYETTDEMMEQASEQLASQMRDWMLADREIVSQSPNSFFKFE